MNISMPGKSETAAGPPEAERETLRGYSLALLAVVAATLLTGLLTLAGSAPTFTLFLLAVMVGAWYGGRRAGAAVTLLAAMVGAYLFIPPAGSLQIGAGRWLETGLFVLVGLLTNVMVAGRRRAETRQAERAERAARLLVENQQTHRQLEEAYALLDALFETAPVGLSFCDREQRFVRINQTLARSNGLEVAAHLGYTLAELYPEWPLTAWITEQWRQILAGGEAVLDVEIQYEPEPGVVVYQLVNWYPVRVGQEIVGVGSVILDITERKRLERDLRAGEERYRRIVETANEGIWLIDAEDRTTYINVRGAAILGYRPEEVMSCPPVEFIFPEEMPHVIEQLARRREGKTESREFRMRCKDGSTGWIHYTAAPIFDDRGTYGGSLAMFTDITERKQAEQERERLYKAEMAARVEAERELAARVAVEARLKESLAEKQVLLRGVNHRVKNNLQAVTNLLYLQSLHIKDEQARQKLAETQGRIKSIGLIHERLYRTQNFTRINFAEYVEDLVGQLIRSHQANPERIRLVVACDQVTLDVDAAVPLGIIVNELASNALKHAFPGDRAGEIKIELRPAAGNRLRLTVSDDGVGMPEGFDPAKTTSLGLQLVQLLARTMRGGVELERGAGARFVIEVEPAG